MSGGLIDLKSIWCYNSLRRTPVETTYIGKCQPLLLPLDIFLDSTFVPLVVCPELLWQTQRLGPVEIQACRVTILGHLKERTDFRKLYLNAMDVCWGFSPSLTMNLNRNDSTSPYSVSPYGVKHRPFGNNSHRYVDQFNNDTRMTPTVKSPNHL